MRGTTAKVCDEAGFSVMLVPTDMSMLDLDRKREPLVKWLVEARAAAVQRYRRRGAGPAWRQPGPAKFFYEFLQAPFGVDWME